MPDSDRTEYVVGFLFDVHKAQVLLIEKQRPAWQHGRLNGIGGHIEPGETPLAAMRREFKEEAGLDIADWELAVVMTGKMWKVYFFSASGDVFRARAQTDERVGVEWSRILPLNVLPNLRWLIPLCLDSDIKKPVILYDKAESEESHA